MAFLSLLAWYYGRSFHPVILLFFVAALSLLINPSYGWNDLGWALSFLSFAGVMILAPLLQAYFFGDKKPGTVRQILGETFSAQLVTAPLLIMTFGQISVVGLPFVPFIYNVYHWNSDGSCADGRGVAGATDRVATWSHGGGGAVVCWTSGSGAGSHAQWLGHSCCLWGDTFGCVVSAARDTL